MHILITGGTGFIGAALLPALRQQGHELSVMTRSPRDSEKGLRYIQDFNALDSTVDGVINLAGASLAGRRWNTDYKREIVESRLCTTQALGDFFRERSSAPQFWLNASAIGYYGAQEDEELGEDAAPGKGFAAGLCQDWEQAAVEAAGEARLCLLRLGVVLDRDGGAYQQMAQPFRMGVANWIGDGEQWLSWIHRADVVAAMLFLIEHETLSGPFNLTAPSAVTSKGFCQAMKASLRTWLTLPMPAVAMRLMVGEMADELLITGQRVVPNGLLKAGFTFTYPEATTAIAAIESQ